MIKIMEIRKFIHREVQPDGTIKNKGRQRGQIETSGGILISAKGGGCGSPGCHCSDGHWISISLPRTKNGIVQGLTVQFDSPAEMEKFFKKRISLSLK
jgi:hypothetical protein